MAPKGRGGGGSGGSGSVDISCPGAFSGYNSTITPVTFSNYVVFTVLTFAVLIAMCSVRKRHPHARKLAGGIFGLSLFLMWLCYVLNFVGALVVECGRINIYEYYNFQIVITVFSSLSEFLLLFVIVYSINTLLRERLGSGQSLYKIICIVILGFMALITAAYTGLLAFVYWQNTPDGQDSNVSVTRHVQKLSFAYYLLYLFSVLASSALAIITINQLRAKRVPASDPLLWVGVITFLMFFQLLLTCIVQGVYMDPDPYDMPLSLETRQAFAYLTNFFLLFSYIAILYFGKSIWWNAPIDATNPLAYQNTMYPQQTQYTPLPPNQPQQWAYVAQPVQQIPQQPQYPQQQPQPQPQYPQQPPYAVPELVGQNGHSK